jgi:DNA invertase Pin-like site-specific DNA recombinase
MAILQEVSDALSDLQALRGRTGDESKIKPEQVEKIKALLKQGKSLAQVAKATGLSTATAHRYSKSPDMEEFFRSQRAKLLRPKSDDLFNPPSDK